MTGDNFNDWYRSLRIVLRVAGTYDYLFKPCPEEPPEDALLRSIKAAWKTEYKIHSDVACLKLGRMSTGSSKAKKENPKKDQACHYCNVVGHWKRNCPLYLKELRTNKNKKAEHGAAPSGIRVEMKLSYEEQYLQRLPMMARLPFQKLQQVELQLGKKIKALRSDRGGEYLSQEFKEYLGKNGIVQHLTSPYTPQQNGVSERRNRTLLDMVRSMFNLTTLPLSFWDYALESAAWGDLNLKNSVSRDNDLEDDHMDTLPLNGHQFAGGKGAPGGVVHFGKLEILGIDYEETFSPVADIRAIRILIAIAAYYDYEIWQIDGNNIPRLKEVKDYLGKCFSMKDLGEAAYILGIKIYKIDLTRCTRPDVAFAQNLVSRYQQNPGKLHWVAVKHILKYLRNTRDMFLVYGGKPDTELNVTGFCDASWQCDKDDTKSQTGYVFVVNGGAVDWKSKKQTTIAMSAAQAEYMAASEAAMEVVWIRKFVGDLGVMPSIKEPINMYCDNSAAIIFAKDSGIMKGARHFLRRYHTIENQPRLVKSNITSSHR
ncbi:retrotransposon protein, putative, ty1-copia subclass [Tanacetum coccineum]